MQINTSRECILFINITSNQLYRNARLKILVLILAVLSLTACSATSNSFLSVTTRIMNSLEANAKLLPAYHNIPATIAGLNVLAVETSETNACLPQGVTIVILKSNSSNIQTHLAASENGEVIQALKQIDPERNWLLQFVGPSVTFAEISSTNSAWNAVVSTSDCPTLGGLPLPLPTSTSNS